MPKRAKLKNMCALVRRRIFFMRTKAGIESLEIIQSIIKYSIIVANITDTGIKLPCDSISVSWINLKVTEILSFNFLTCGDTPL